MIIPAYNAEAHVAAAIRSVLSQTYQDFEIVVVDDGSTDNTSSALADFGDAIVHVTQPNSGAAAARNTALRHASGELIALLDADDLWLPRRLERMVAYLDENPHVGFATSDAYLRHEDMPSTQTYYREVVYCRRLPANQSYSIVQYNFVFTMAVIRRRLLAEHGDFDTGLQVAEDWDLWIRFILAGEQLGLVHEPLAYYRIRSSGLTISDRSPWDRDIREVRRRGLAHEAINRTPGSARDLLLPAARAALAARRRNEAAVLFRGVARDPKLSAADRLRARSAALFPFLARVLWPELVLKVRPDGAILGPRRRVHRPSPNAVDGRLERVYVGEETVHLSGWATDSAHRKPAQCVAIFDGDTLIGVGHVDQPRPKIARRFGNPRLADCGFRVVVPTASVTEPTTLRVLALCDRNVGALARAKRR
ncbi:MAG: glycosyltransferase [Sporichthyaceae bacterium]